MHSFFSQNNIKPTNLVVDAIQSEGLVKHFAIFLRPWTFPVEYLHFNCSGWPWPTKSVPTVSWWSRGNSEPLAMSNGSLSHTC